MSELTRREMGDGQATENYPPFYENRCFAFTFNDLFGGFA